LETASSNQFWGKSTRRNILKGLSLFTTPFLQKIDENLTVETNLTYHNDSFCQYEK